MAQWDLTIKKCPSTDTCIYRCQEAVPDVSAVQTEGQPTEGDQHVPFTVWHYRPAHQGAAK